MLEEKEPGSPFFPHQQYCTNFTVALATAETAVPGSTSCSCWDLPCSMSLCESHIISSVYDAWIAKRGSEKKNESFSCLTYCVPVSCLVLVLGGNLFLVVCTLVPALLGGSFKGEDRWTRIWEVLTVEEHGWGEEIKNVNLLPKWGWVVFEPRAYKYYSLFVYWGNCYLQCWPHHRSISLRDTIQMSGYDFMLGVLLVHFAVCVWPMCLHCLSVETTI